MAGGGLASAGCHAHEEVDCPGWTRDGHKAWKEAPGLPPPPARTSLNGL